ncbi:MAG: carbon starvation protein A, partial [Fuerstiella sp.]
ALGWNMFHEGGWLNNEQPNYVLAGFGLVILGLQAWMVAECLVLLPKVKGVLEEALPPLAKTTAGEASQVAPAVGGPNC